MDDPIRVHAVSARWRLVLGFVAAAIGAALPLTAAPVNAAAQTLPPSLVGETLNAGIRGAGTATITASCNPTGTSTISFTASGVATGPYPGTFTASGSASIGPETPGRFDQLPFMVQQGPVTAFNETFEIDSPATSTTIKGSKTLLPAGTFTGNTGFCDVNETNVTGTQFCSTGSCTVVSGVLTIFFFTVDATYQATISSPSGQFADSGLSTAFAEQFSQQLTLSNGQTSAGASGPAFDEGFNSSNGVVPIAQPTTCPTSIAQPFNGTPITAGNWVWFSSVLKVSGLPSNSPATVDFTNQTISFNANGISYQLKIPDAEVTFSPTATTATTVFASATNVSQTTVPSSGLAGNVFFAGLPFQVPVNFSGGINPVTWSGTISSFTPGLNVQWQWAAAVYTTFSPDPNLLGVKPVDDNKASIYQNSDQAGTPENFKQSVTGGATGGGGSNFTGSLSATVSCSV